MYPSAQQQQQQFGAVNPLAVVNTVTGITGVVTGLLNNDGPDPEKYKERGKFISSLVGMAQAGDIRAWHALGAYGWPKIKTPVELPAPYSRPKQYGGDGKTKPVGWALDGNEWGDVYKPLRESANDAHEKLAYKFNAGAVPIAGGGPIVIPTVPPAGGGGGSGGGTPGNNLPTYTQLPTGIPAPMDPAYPAGGPAPVAQAGMFGGLSPVTLGALALGALLLAGPRRNPPLRRRRAARRRVRR